MIKKRERGCYSIGEKKRWQAQKVGMTDKLRGERGCSYPDRVLHCVWTALSAHSDFLGSRVYAFLGVTSHLHFWQNDRDLLHAMAVTTGRMDTKLELAQKVNSGEENSSATFASIQIRNLSITSLVLYQQAIRGTLQ